MININGIPQCLRDTGLFCLWRYEERNGKKTKVPYNPRTGGGAQSNNVATFAPFLVAQEVYNRGGYDGIGVGIFGDLCAIDIDHCVDEDTDETDERANAIIQLMDSYAELSPSRTGVHIYFRAPGFQYDKVAYYINNQKMGLEVYVAGATNKFLTVTGAALNDLPIVDRSDALKVVLDSYMLRPQKPADSSSAPAPIDLADAELIAKMRKASNGATFSALWAGDTSGYPSHSEADIALCNILAFWTGRNELLMDGLFRQSGLMRNKWDRPQSGSTYGKITIQDAIAKCKSVYSPKYRNQDPRTEYPIMCSPNGSPNSRVLDSPQSVKPPDYSDAGNATVFGQTYQNDLIFVDALGWLWWNGKKWERDDHKAVSWALCLSERMLKDAVTQHGEALIKQAEAKARFAETGEDADKEAVKASEGEVAKTKAYLAHAKQTRNATRIKNMMELSKPTLVIKADRLDSNPFDLNTPSGIVDLTTGKLRPHERSAYCSQITQASPDGNGEKMWDNFLDTITCEDGSVKGFLQMVAGMALIGAVYQEGIIIAYGGGRNGKSTVFNAIGQAVGDYTGSIDIKTITTDRANKGASLATLRGKRLVITGELEEHQRLSVATLKQLASTDKLVIEEKFRQPETVTQTHTLVLFTNHLPRVGSTDGGTWRRLIVVPFLATIPVGTGVQNYADVLIKEAGGAILSWAIEGAVNFIKNGYRLEIPDVIAEATEAYREREDWLTNFIDERCILEPNAETGAAELYREYREWAESTGDYIRRLNDFDTAMETAGFKKKRPQNRKKWIGLKINLQSKFGSPYVSTG